MAFVVLIGFGAVRQRGPVAECRAARSGLAFGVLAFLAASLTMHPLLIPEVAAAFWIMLGLCRSSAVHATTLSLALLRRDDCAPLHAGLGLAQARQRPQLKIELQDPGPTVVARPVEALKRRGLELAC